MNNFNDKAEVGFSAEMMENCHTSDMWLAFGNTPKEPGPVHENLSNPAPPDE